MPAKFYQIPPPPSESARGWRDRRVVLTPYAIAALAFGIVLAFALPPSALAQSARREADLSRARELFAEGVRLTGESDFPGAEARFREALAVRDAPAIRYNLASVLFEQGEYPEAAALASSAAHDLEATADITGHANELSAQIAERAGFVRFDTGGTPAVLTIDGYELAGLVDEIPLSPGEHTVVASVEGVERARDTVYVSLGEHRVVPLDVLAAPVDEGEGEGGSRPIVEEPALWIGVGIGVVVVTAVIIGAAVAASGPEAPIEGNFSPGVLRW